MKQSELKAIIKECVEETMLEEGMFDRLKSNISGIGGAYNYAAKSGLHGLKSKIFGTQYDKYNSDKNKTLATNTFKIKKIEKYKKIASDKIDKLANEIVSDLNKMGIETKGFSPKQMNFFKHAMEKSLQDIIDKTPGEAENVKW